MENTKTILESILLSEGRIEKARERYPDIPEDVFNYLVNNDPSGNQKYLDWMLSQSKNLSIQGLKNFLIDRITYFHENSQSFEQKDINSYKDYNDLGWAITKVKEKKEVKKLKSEAKKQKTVIHDDEKFLVVSPHSHKASCYYGAGTKWCITTRNSDQYYNQYTKRATFYFIIDKTKDSKDRLYKVALRMIGGKKRIELWDAGDSQIYGTRWGDEYMETLPEDLLVKIELNHEKYFPASETFDPETPQEQALFNFSGEEDINLEDFSHYGLDVYMVGDTHYAIGSEYDFDEALYTYYDSYDDGELIENFDYEGYYLYLNDEDGFIDEIVDSYMDNISDEECLEYTGYYDEYSELEDRLGEEDSEEDEIEDRMNELIERSREIVAENERDSWENCISSGVVECLVNDRGWYNSAYELYNNSSLVELDRDGLIDSFGSEYEVLSHYDGYIETEEDDDGDTWYIVRVD